jgi:hypothetical protein
MRSRMAKAAMGFIGVVSMLVLCPIAAAADDSLTLYVDFVAEQDTKGGFKELAIHDGDELRSGNGIKIFFEVDRPAHVAVLLFDSTGKGHVLYPNDPKVSGKKLAASDQRQLPSDPLDYFILDQNTGTETLYVVAKLEPLADLQILIAHLQNMGKNRDQDSADGAVEDFVTSRAGITRKKYEKARDAKIKAADRGKAKGVRKDKGPKPMLIAGVVRGIKVVAKSRPFRMVLSDGRASTKQAPGVTDTGAVVRAVSFIHR